MLTRAVDSAAAEQTLDTWQAQVAAVRAGQPDWSSPLVTTSALLEQRVRFDTQFQHAESGATTVNLDGGKGVDLIVAEQTELQIAAAPYVIRTGTGALSGIGDWPAVRLKQRLASSPRDDGNYVVSAWLQAQAPVGIAPLTNHTLTFLPTLGMGKGWGPVVIQGTLGMVIPTARQDVLGVQIAANVAVQLLLLKVFWPQVELNATQYRGGQRDGKRQLYVTPGVVVGRYALTDRLTATLGAGYQIALAPSYRATPLLPAYASAWVTTARLGF